MAVRRLWYWVAALASFVLYIAYGEWLAWMLLLVTLGLPWFSLALSLPGICALRLSPSGPDWVPLGERADLMILGACSLPMPPFRGRILLENILLGDKQLYDPAAGFTAYHCGGYRCTIEKPRVYDYLGLCSFRVRKTEPKTLLVRPEPLPLTAPENLLRHTASRWKPKFGGGFAENHELRLYRPGDNLNQVHWKLSAKTGKLILREPMEPIRGLILLTMTLRGTPEELDRKFGRLLWLSRWLLDQGFSHELRVLTGDGLLAFPIGREGELTRAIDTLLCTPAVQEGSIRERSFRASWQYHIGGDADEA